MRLISFVFGDGDSLDRERVRDILLEEYNYKLERVDMPLTQDELQTVINLVDARLERQYNEEYQTILDKLTEFQWRTYQ